MRASQPRNRAAVINVGIHTENAPAPLLVRSHPVSRTPSRFLGRAAPLPAPAFRIDWVYRSDLRVRRRSGRPISNLDLALPAKPAARLNSQIQTETVPRHAIG